MPKRKMNFEILPVRVAMARIQRAQKGVTSAVCCAVCGEAVPLEYSKTDERGKAVHEECYVATTTGSRQPFGAR